MTDTPVSGSIQKVRVVQLRPNSAFARGVVPGPRLSLDWTWGWPRFGSGLLTSLHGMNPAAEVDVRAMVTA